MPQLTGKICPKKSKMFFQIAGLKIRKSGQTGHKSGVRVQLSPCSLKTIYGGTSKENHELSENKKNHLKFISEKRSGAPAGI